MSSLQERLFDDRPSLIRELATSIAGDLTTAVAQRGRASLVVSGGGTPRPLFEALSQISLPWPQVYVTLADERWVDAQHEASNERLVRHHLLVGEAAGARMVGLKNNATTPEQGQQACENALAALPRPFDTVVLGMGGDGHTASLFPHTPALEVGLDPQSEQSCLAAHPQGAAHSRISLTLAALSNSRRLIIHITGDDKRRVLLQAAQPGPVAEYPIRAVLESGHPNLQLYWAS